MAEFTCEYNADDVAELIIMVRVQKLRKNEEWFAKHLGIDLLTLRRAEQGKSRAWVSILQKMIDLKLVKVKLEIEV